MPTYEFRCPNGHEFEHLHRRISDAPSVMKCPVCGEEAARLISGGAGLVFKGSGFYLTDYGRNAHRKSAPGGEGKKSEGGSGGEGGSSSGSSESGGSKAGGSSGESSGGKGSDASKPSSSGGSSSGSSSSTPKKAAE